MKSVLYAVAAILLYAPTNVILEQKLAKYHAVAILLYSYPVLLTISLGIFLALKLSGAPVNVPQGKMVLLVATTAVVWFFADYLFLSAYTNGGDMMAITSILIMLPAVAATIRYFWIGGLPNMYQVAGYILAVLAVFLISRGST